MLKRLDSFLVDHKPFKITDSNSNHPANQNHTIRIRTTNSNQLNTLMFTSMDPMMVLVFRQDKTSTSIAKWFHLTTNTLNHVGRDLVVK